MLPSHAAGHIPICCAVILEHTRIEAYSAFVITLQGNDCVLALCSV